MPVALLQPRSTNEKSSHNWKLPVSIPVVLHCEMQEMPKRARSTHLWMTGPLFGTLHSTLSIHVQCHTQTGMRMQRLFAWFQLCSTSGQDKNSPLWQMIPQRKCFEISILKESKQTAGGHGMTKLQTLEQCVWKRYEFYNDGVVMQCYQRLFLIFWTMLAFNITIKA